MFQANDLEISIGFCYSILTDEFECEKEICEIGAKTVNIQNQMERGVEVCLTFKHRIANVPHFIKSIITDDKPWVYGYDPETKAQRLGTEYCECTLTEKFIYQVRS